jgi:aryl-alcohol dehydrogenase-like predicted oxidoreductase
MTTLALAWLLNHPQVTAAIVGPRHPGQLEPALQALEMTLSEADHQTIAGLFD